ncbi:MAG: hypothetical protein SGPRY_011263, partial [Prymnesium sp.]
EANTIAHEDLSVGQRNAQRAKLETQSYARCKERFEEKRQQDGSAHREVLWFELTNTAGWAQRLHVNDRDLTGAASVKRAQPKLTALFARRVSAFIKDQHLGTISEKQQTQRAAKRGRDARIDDEADAAGPSSTEAHHHTDSRDAQEVDSSDKQEILLSATTGKELVVEDTERQGAPLEIGPEDPILILKQE